MSPEVPQNSKQHHPFYCVSRATAGHNNRLLFLDQRSNSRSTENSVKPLWPCHWMGHCGLVNFCTPIEKGKRFWFTPRKQRIASDEGTPAEFPHCSCIWGLPDYFLIFCCSFSVEHREHRLEKWKANPHKASLCHALTSPARLCRKLIAFPSIVHVIISHHTATDRSPNSSVTRGEGIKSRRESHASSFTFAVFQGFF